MDFIDTHPFRRLEVMGLLQCLDIVVGDVADGAFRDADFLGDAGERIVERAGTDPPGQAFRHAPLSIHIGERFHERLAAIPAFEAPCVNIETHPFAVHG